MSRSSLSYEKKKDSPFVSHENRCQLSTKISYWTHHRCIGTRNWFCPHSNRPAPRIWTNNRNRWWQPWLTQSQNLKINENPLVNGIPAEKSKLRCDWMVSQCVCSQWNGSTDPEYNGWMDGVVEHRSHNTLVTWFACCTMHSCGIAVDVCIINLIDSFAILWFVGPTQCAVSLESNYLVIDSVEIDFVVRSVLCQRRMCRQVFFCMWGVKQILFKHLIWASHGQISEEKSGTYFVYNQMVKTAHTRTLKQRLLCPCNQTTTWRTIHAVCTSRAEFVLCT